MGLKERRQRHKELFRGEILAAARELFLLEGYAKFSMRKLAARIEHSPTTIYLYFRDKDDLLLNICEELSAAFHDSINEIRSTVPEPREALRLVLHKYIEIGLTNPEQYKVVFFTNPTVYGTPDDFMKRDTMGRRYYVCFQELVDECMRSGALRNTDCAVLTQVFWAAVHGLVTLFIFTDDFPMADSSVMADILINGLLKGHDD